MDIGGPPMMISFEFQWILVTCLHWLQWPPLAPIGPERLGGWMCFFFFAPVGTRKIKNAIQGNHCIWKRHTGKPLYWPPLAPIGPHWRHWPPLAPIKKWFSPGFYWCFEKVLKKQWFYCCFLHMKVLKKALVLLMFFFTCKKWLSLGPYCKKS